MLVILDYHIGNLTSVKNMLAKGGYNDALISGDVGAIREATRLILPGVGSFEYGMTKLRQSPYFDELNRKVLDDKTPVLGICLGAQLLLDGSEEGAPVPGLGWIPGRVTRFRAEALPKGLKIPHMGWSEVEVAKDSQLFADMHPDPRFYFVHSYHMEPAAAADALVWCEHGYRFVAGVEHGNVAGVQFHPEKSHKFGMKLLSNFVHNFGR